MLATLVPGGLMLGTFALERVEGMLGKPSEDDRKMTEMLAQIRPQRELEPPPASPRQTFGLMNVLDHEGGLPTRVFRPAGVNPQFQPTRRINGV
ncbi:hypothetical protein CQY22_011595 [Mycolicibacterium brumae]|uniref:Uncharacterized protein n=1 Tax=Mycolicibacterium brumae TaxID=85968 RepID=A0A2G5P8X1_9MYCO|nr:hypothetical protein CQY22_011595 [Mycolicibacterium brumae]